MAQGSIMAEQCAGTSRNEPGHRQFSSQFVFYTHFIYNRVQLHRCCWHRTKINELNGFPIATRNCSWMFWLRNGVCTFGRIPKQTIMLCIEGVWFVYRRFQPRGCTNMSKCEIIQANTHTWAYTFVITHHTYCACTPEVENSRDL